VAIGVCLRFDEQTTELVEQIWRSLGSDILQLGYPPHLTLIVANDEVDVGVLVRALPQIAHHVPASVELGGPRAFPGPEVAYLECRGDLGPLHRLVADLVPHDALHEHYRPETWTPHVTLQTKGDVRRALAVAVQEWRVCDAMPIAVDLLTFPPVAVHASVSVGQR
jgi:2'-5' RNA ligase